MSYMMVAANSPTNLEKKTCSWSFMSKIDANTVKDRQHRRFLYVRGFRVEGLGWMFPVCLLAYISAKIKQHSRNI